MRNNKRTKSKKYNYSMFFYIYIAILFIGLQISVFAEEGLPNTPIDKLEFVQKDSSSIKGTFVASNSNNTYDGNMVYVTEVYKGTQMSEWELINKSQHPFEIYPYQTKTVSFTHMLPANIETNSYHMIIRILTRTGLVAGFRLEEIGEIKGSNYFLDSKGNDAKIIKDGEEVFPLAGPTYTANQTPQAYIIFTNPTTNTIRAYPETIVYARDYHFKEAPVNKDKGDVVEFQPNETKKVTISLPAQSEPESYLAAVTMIDEKGKAVSGVREFRYVIGGVSAKILNASASFDKSTSKLNLKIYAIGPADATEIKGAIVEVNVYDDKDGKQIKNEQKTVDLGPQQQIINTEILLETMAANYRVDAAIKYDSKILDASTMKIPGQAFDERKPIEEPQKPVEEPSKPAKPQDVKGTVFEEAVNNLIDKGIINGYNDGTFKPMQDITRAEFAKIVCCLLDEQKNSEKAKGTTKFKDVKGNHWASGYINIASQKKLIKGYPDGTFKAEDNVTYAEAVTILVRALGYGTEVDSKGKWPQNYLAKAKELGITVEITLENPDVKAVRGDIAILTWNTFKKK